MSNCKPILIDDKYYVCPECGFTREKDFIKECNPPHKCIHLGEVTQTIDTKNCGCSARGIEIKIHKCNLYNTDCGLINVLKYDKKKELLDKGIRDCSKCPNRFDQENSQNGV